MRTNKKKAGEKRPGHDARGAQTASRRVLPWAIGLAVVVFGAFLISKQLRPSGSKASEAAQAEKPAPDASTNASATNTTETSALTAEREREAMAAQLNGTANNLLKAGNPAGAAQAYRQAIALTPNDEDLHFNLGIAYVRQGDLTNAELAYTRALELLPDYPEVHNNLGNLLMRQGRFKEAEEHFLEALEQMPEYAQAHNNLGILRQRQMMTNEALASFQKAVQYETNYWEARFNLANAYLSANEREKGIAELRETLRLNPGMEMAQRILAKALAQSSNGTPTTEPPKQN